MAHCFDLQAVCALGGIPDHMNEKRELIFVIFSSEAVLKKFLLRSLWYFLTPSLSCRSGRFRWSRQRHGKWRLSRSAESREWAEPGGHRRRGLDAPGPKASEGCLLFLLRQPSREPQKEEEQKQTQVHNQDTRHSVSACGSISPSSFWLCC